MKHLILVGPVDRLVAPRSCNGTVTDGVASKLTIVRVTAIVGGCAVEACEGTARDGELLAS